MILIIIMNKTSILLLVAIITLIAGCSSTTNQGENQSSTNIVVASFFPTQEITQNLLLKNNDFEVKGLIPKGSDPHSYEPTPKQIIDVSNADVFITMGGIFEHIEKNILQSNPDIYVIKATKFLGENYSAHEHDLETSESDSEEHGHEESMDPHSDSDSLEDPHIWLSIHNMEKMTDEIAQQLIEKYPYLREEIEANARAYKKKLEELEKKFEEGLAVCKHDKIIVNHKAFGYLAEEYDFEQISVAGFNPESEPSGQTIQKVIDTAREYNLSYVFSEGAYDSSTSQTIAQDIEGSVIELNPLLQERHNNYFDLMEENLKNLKIGLECE